MYLIVIVGLVLNYFGTHCAPVESIYTSLQKTINNPKFNCSQLRTSIFFSREPDYLSKCLTVATVDKDYEFLCTLYSNNLLYLCKTVTTSNLENSSPIFSNASILESFKKPVSGVCEPFTSNPYYYPGFEKLDNLIKQFTPQSCLAYCMDSHYTIKPICNAIAFMISATTEVLKAPSSNTKPQYTMVEDRKDASAQSLNEKKADKKATQKPFDVPAPQEQQGEVIPVIPVVLAPSTSRNESKSGQQNEAPKSQEVSNEHNDAREGLDNTGDINVIPETQQVASPEPKKSEQQQLSQADQYNKLNSNQVVKEEETQNGAPSTNDLTPKEEAHNGALPNDLTPKGEAHNGAVVTNDLTHKQPASNVAIKKPAVEEAEAVIPPQNDKTTLGNNENQNQEIVPVVVDTEKKKKPNTDAKEENVLSQPEKPFGGQPNKNDDDEYGGVPNLEDAGDDGTFLVEDDLQMPPKENPKTSEVKITPVENSKPHQIIEDDVSLSANYQNQSIEDSDSYFFSYFMMVCIIFICGYVAYHNKQKILALVVEGRQGRRNSRTRRPNSANYRKLDSNLEEAVTSSCTKNTTQIIY